MESSLNSKSSRSNVKPTLFFMKTLKYSGHPSSPLQNPEIKSAGSQGPLPTFLYKTILPFKIINYKNIHNKGWNMYHTEAVMSLHSCWKTW